MHSSKKVVMDNKKKGPGLLFAKLGIVVLAVFGFTVGGLAFYGDCEKRNYDGCYQYKLQLLKNSANERKAVFIGGSSTNFGIHAKLFEEETGIRAINMGLSAGRSFEAYLESVKPYIKDGDYVFMCPEHPYYHSEFHNIDNGTSMFYLFQNFDAIKINNATDVYNTVKYSLYNGWTGWLNAILQVFDEMLVDVFHTKTPAVYDRWTCNENGDFTFHKDLTPTIYTPGNVSSALNSFTFFDGLRNYINEWKQTVNFTPYLLFAPIDENAIAGDLGFPQLEELIEERTGIKILNSQLESAYPREYFFDTYYHLKWEYGDTHTQLIIDKFIHFDIDNEII